MPNLVEQIALDSISEGLHYGELLENTLDNFPESARFMVADRMRRGKLIAGSQSDYGFRYDGTLNGRKVNEFKTTLVQHVFRMADAEGLTRTWKRNRCYKAIDLTVLARKDGTAEVN